MTKRKLLAIIIILAMCVSLSACASQSEREAKKAEKDAEKDAFFNIDENYSSSELTVLFHAYLGDSINYQTVMYDHNTMVMYVFLQGYDSGAMSLLYNADGSLKLYNPNAELVPLTVVGFSSFDICSGITHQKTIYDPDTMVMYEFIDSPEGGDMTVLYNADGTLKLYSPEY